jgi:putative oxidoreductase
MSMDLRHLQRYQAELRAALRIMTALLFMEHGLAKLVHFPVPHPGLSDPPPAILVAVAYIELIGGALLALGLFTRPGAVLTAGEMATGYFLFHFPPTGWKAGLGCHQRGSSSEVPGNRCGSLCQTRKT